MAKSRLDPFDVFVGARVRMQRRAVAMSQILLGERIGVTFQQVQKYELGKNRISASMLQKIANAMGVPVDFFFLEHEIASAEEPLGISEEVARYLASKEHLDLTRVFAKIKDTSVRENIIRLIESIAAR